MVHDHPGPIEKYRYQAIVDTTYLPFLRGRILRGYPSQSSGFQISAFSLNKDAKLKINIIQQQ